jgi:peptide/nickel transport system substrate-binding protein
MKKTKLVLLLLALVLVAAALVGCGPKAGSEGGGNEDGAVNTTVTYGLQDEPATVDAAFAYDYVVNPVCIQITEGLLKYDHDDQLQPQLVEKWEEVDALTYVYDVRQDVVFSDGSPMTIEDVLYSINRFRDPEVASYLLWMYDNVESIEQTGDWQFTVKLKMADALWKHTFATTAGHIGKKSVIEEQGDNYGKPSGAILGTGPYVLDKWTSGQEIVLKENTNYWDKAKANPDIKEIVFQFIPEDATRALAVTSGQIDIDAQMPPEKIEEVKNSEAANAIVFPTGGLRFLAFNNQKPPFNDINVRRAIVSAIDCTAIQDNITKDGGVPTNYISVPPAMFLFEKPEWEKYEKTANKYPYDVAAAKKFLAASSKPDGFEFELIVAEASLDNSEALAIQQYLKEINVTVNIKKVTGEENVSLEFGADMKDGQRPYDAGIYEWYSDFPDPSGAITPIYLGTNWGEGGSNSACYDNKEVDKLLRKQGELTDDAERTSVMFQALDIIGEEVPLLPYTHPNYLWGVNKRVAIDPDELTTMWIWNLFLNEIKLNK